MVIVEPHRANPAVNSVQIEQRMSGERDLTNGLVFVGKMDLQLQHGVLGLVAPRNETAAGCGPRIRKILDDLDVDVAFAYRDALSHVFLNGQARHVTVVVY